MQRTDILAAIVMVFVGLMAIGVLHDTSKMQHWRLGMEREMKMYSEARDAIWWTSLLLGKELEALHQRRWSYGLEVAGVVGFGIHDSNRVTIKPSMVVLDTTLLKGYEGRWDAQEGVGGFLALP